jgi:hypothetical protein
MSTPTDTPATPPPPRRLSLGWLSLDTWAVSAAVIFILLVVAGIFPRVPW